jgi:hypothetical protein
LVWIALSFLPSIKRSFITYLCSVRSILILWTSDNVRLEENDFTPQIGDRLIICKWQSHSFFVVHQGLKSHGNETDRCLHS